MAPMRRKVALAGLLGLACASFVAAPASADHLGVTADCGPAGQLTLRATETTIGLQAPRPTAVLLFEEGGTLSVQRVYVNGNLVWNPAAVAQVSNSVDEVTCSFSYSGGDMVITGIYTGW